MNGLKRKCLFVIVAASAQGGPGAPGGAPPTEGGGGAVTDGGTPTAQQNGNVAGAGATGAQHQEPLPPRSVRNSKLQENPTETTKFSLLISLT